MGLLDNLFKPKPESSGGKTVESSGNPEPGEQHTAAVQPAGASGPKGSPFLAPKVYVPRSSMQIVPPARSQLQTDRQSEASCAPKEIVLTLGDVLSRIPPHFLRQGVPDARRELRFPADGLSADIARGRAAVFLADIVAQCPDVFLPEADGFDDIQIRLPLQKLVEQVGLAPGSGSANPGDQPEHQPPVPAMLPPVLIANNPAVQLPPSPVVDSILQGEQQIHLSLAAILKRCPNEIIVQPLPPIDESVRIAFPFPPIERQLATGQVEVSSLRFIAALPLGLMKYFEAKAGVKVPLPLEEIFQNLPNQAPPLELGPSAEERDRAFQNAKLAEAILLEPMDAPEGKSDSVSDAEVLLSELSVLASSENVVIAANFASPPPAVVVEPEVHAPLVAESPTVSIPEIPVELPKGNPSAEAESKLAVPPPVAPIEPEPHEPPVSAPEIHVEPSAPPPAPVSPVEASAFRPFVPSLRPPVLLQPKAGSEELRPAAAISSQQEAPSPPIASAPVEAPVDSAPEVPNPSAEFNAPESEPVSPAPAPEPPTAGALQHLPAETAPVAVAAESDVFATELPAAALCIGPQQFRPAVVLPPQVIASPPASSTPAPRAPAVDTMPAAAAPVVPEPITNPEPEPPAAVETSAAPNPPEVPPVPVPLVLGGKVREMFAGDSPLELPRASQLLAALPGIRGCIVTARAAEFHGGELPAGFDVSAVRDIGRRMHSALAGRGGIFGSGHVHHVTLHAEDCSLSFFTRGEACVCAVHRARIFLPGVREKFAAVAEELADALSQTGLGSKQ